MSRKIKLITPKGEATTFINTLGRSVEVEPDNVEDVLLLALGCKADRLSNEYITPEDEERIKTLTHKQRLDLLLSDGAFEIKELEVNDDIEKLPKKIKYGNGLWYPEILLKQNDKSREHHWDNTFCYYDQFPGGEYLWEIRYKRDGKNQYMNTNNAGSFSSEYLVGVGLTLSDAVFEIEKGLRTKFFEDFSNPSEEERKYYEVKAVEEE